MDNLLSLDQVAEILGVEYKTVYKLVRKGKLPAGKVGRVYRVKREDIDNFFESSKEQLAKETQRELTPVCNLQCCVTGNRIVSNLDIGGYAQNTGQPICRTAWEEGHRSAQILPQTESQTRMNGDIS